MIMEFAGFHLQHQLQEESAQCTTSATPPDYKPSNSQSWIPSNIYNGCTNGFRTESFTHSRELGHKYGMIDSLRTSTVQAFGFHDATKSFTQQQPASDLLPARINDKRLSDDLPKLSELMKYRSSKAVDESCSLISISEPQYSPSFFSSCRVNGKEFLPAENFYHVQKPIDGGMALIKRYNFGGVSSISNLSTLDMTSSLVSCSLGLNSQMLDMHTSFSGSCGLQLCYDTFGLNEFISYSNIHGCVNSPSKSSNKISSITSKVAMTKRPSNCSRSKESEAKAIKKSRPSCPPLKVRKEKLGGRIQTLQRLVAPFGKSSTATVLTEAIGYIHFLHEQIQTLSIPYMKSAQSKPFRMVQLDSEKVDSREFKPDLRSRGLCLVPLSYASFIHRCV